jgi:hypothetical protein
VIIQAIEEQSKENENVLKMINILYRERESQVIPNVIISILCITL